MDRCFIVVHSNYAEGQDAYAFWNGADAKASVIEDANTVIKDLVEQGYNPTELARGDDGIEVYVPGTDIYYEWAIFPSGITASKDRLDKSRQLSLMIDLYIDIAQENFHDDSMIGDKLTDIFRREELEGLGYGNFVKAYFDDEEG